ncbi:MAG: sulfatase-like hydrolase/transferase [Planctomycetes bacterium]|nr:sulfatase-like hydrolase/transferase [Planctomycetota bacterium]
MNVFVAITDSLRIDHVGAYGNDWIKTPSFDKFATESAVFDYAYTEGLPTLPTRTAMFTGRFTFPFRGWQRMEPDDVLLAEVLWDKGVRSALVTDCYHMHKASMAYERGFDFVQFIRGQETDPYIVDMDDSVVQEELLNTYKPDAEGKDTRIKGSQTQYLKNTHHWKSDEDHFVAQVVKASLKWIEEQAKKDNLFLWMDCFDPHEPWDPCPPFDMYTDPNYKGINLTQPIPGPVEGYLTDEELNHVFKNYAGEVSLVDKWIGIFFDGLKDMGLWDNSLIIHTTDHGEPFGDHGIIRKAQPYPYEELVHIPWMVRLPGGEGAGKRFDQFIETCDMMPTVLDAFGVRKPRRTHGESILPLIKGEKEKIRDYAYIGHYQQSWRISDREWCYIKWLDDNILNKSKDAPELYNIKDDPTEQNNIIDDNKERAAELDAKLCEFVKKLR